MHWRPPPEIPEHIDRGRTSRAAGRAREVADAAQVGIKAVPALAPYVEHEAIRLRSEAGSRQQRGRSSQDRLTIERMNRDRLAEERLFRDRLGAASERLGRLESGIASVPTRLAVEFPPTPSLNSPRRN